MFFYFYLSNKLDSLKQLVHIQYYHIEMVKNDRNKAFYDEKLFCALQK
jgi:hypothetical protein